MGRTLSGASYDRNDYVLQPHNGGSGCASIEELKERYGMIRENEFNTPGGVLAYDEKGNVPVASLPSQILTRPSTYIKGPVTIVPGGTATYKISNYNESTNYNVSFNGGTILITDDTITITAGTTSGVYELVINNEKYELAIATSLPRDANIATHALLTTDLSKVILSIKTSATIDNGASHFATDYQVATDEDFENVVFFEQMSPNKTEARFVLNKQNQYFIRARVIDTYKQKSAWSNVTNYDIKNIGPTIGTPSAEVRLYKDNTDISVVIEPSSFYSETGQELNYAEVKVYSDSTLTTEVASGQWTDITKTYTFKFTSATENLYTVFRHVSKSGATSYWSKELYKKASELFSTLPVVRRARFLPNPSLNGSTGSYISRQSYMSPNGKWVIIIDGLNPVAYVYNKNKNSDWVLESTINNTTIGIENDGRGYIATINNSGTEVVLGLTNIENPTKACIVIVRRNNSEWKNVQTISTTNFANGSLGTELDISNDGKWIFLSNGDSTEIDSKGYYLKRNASDLFEGPFIIENPTKNGTANSFGGFGVFNETSDRLVISAFYEQGTYQREGSIFIYKLVNDNWVFDVKIKPSDVGINVTYVNLDFGYFIRTKSNRIVVGARGYIVPNGTGTIHGAVVVLRKDGENWVNEATITSPDGPVNAAYFGYNFDVTQNADRIIIGSAPSSVSIYHTLIPPSVYLFERIGNNWLFKHRYTGINPTSLTGRGVNISADGRDLVICTRRELIGKLITETTGAVSFYSPQEKQYEKRYSIYIPSATRSIDSRFTILKGGEFVVLARSSYRQPNTSTTTGAIIILRKVNGVYSIYRTLKPGTVLSQVTGVNAGFSVQAHPTEISFFASYNLTSSSNPEFIDYIKFNESTQEFELIQKITKSRDVANVSEQLGLGYSFDETGNKLFVGSPGNQIAGKVSVFNKENGLYVLKQVIDGATNHGLSAGAEFGYTTGSNNSGTELLIQSRYVTKDGVKTALSQLYYYVLNTTSNVYECKRVVTYQELYPNSATTAKFIKYSSINKCWYFQNALEYLGSKPRVIKLEFINNEPKFTNVIVEPHEEKSVGNGSTFAYIFDINSSEDIIAVGSPDRSYISNREGSIHIFNKVNNVWNKKYFLSGLTGYISEQFGTNLVMTPDGKTLVTVSQMGGSYTNVYESSFYTIIE